MDMLPDFCNDEVTVWRAGSKESRGATVPDWDAATSHALTGCSVQPRTTTMDMDGRTQTELGGTIIAPPDADLRAGDRIEWVDYGGTTHAFVVGEPRHLTSIPQVAHVSADLTEWRG